jgi:hypothetical protein
MQKNVLRFVMVPVFVAVLALGNVARNPHFAAIRGVDLFQIIAAGMCLGVAIDRILFVKRNGMLR